MIEAAFRAAPHDARLRSRVGVVYSFLGRHEDAVPAGRRAAELLPIAHGIRCATIHAVRS